MSPFSPSFLVLSAAVSLLTAPALAEIRCAGEADTITSPVFISNDASLSYIQGTGGSAMFDFGAAEGSFWALAKCPDGNSDSWKLNGVTWFFPHSTNAYIWVEYGPLPEGPVPGQSIAVLSPRERNCQIRAVYFGDDGESLLRGNLTKICDTTKQRGYLCPSHMSLHSPVVFDSTDFAITSPVGYPNAGNGMAVLDFKWSSSFGSASFWVYSLCPDGNHDSWFIDGTYVPIPISTTFKWNKVGTSTGNVVMAPREPGCLIRFAYLGRDTPSTNYVTLCAPDIHFCPRTATVTGNVLDPILDVLVGSCLFNLGDLGSECQGSARFNFGDTRGTFWALTRCETNDTDSWYVNGQEWTIPHSSSFEWHEYGPIDGDGVVELTVHEPECMILQVFRGVNPPSKNGCAPPPESPNSLVRLTEFCQENINCFYGACSEDKAWCQCLDYAYGCNCSLIRTGAKPSRSRCAWNASADGEGFVRVEKPSELYDPENAVVYVTNETNVVKFTINTTIPEVTSVAVCVNDTVFARGLSIDADGGFYVADSGAGVVRYVSPNCEESTVVIPHPHHISTPGDVEILHASGKLAVAAWGGVHGIFLVQVNERHEMVHYVNTNATSGLARGLTECQDDLGNTGFLFVEDGKRLMFFDTIQHTTTLVFSSPDVTSISDVEYRPCGIFFTTSTEAQVWVCAEPGPFARCTSGGSHCQRLCDPMSAWTSACSNLWNPYGIASDGRGNLFVGNEANDNLAMYIAGQTDGAVIATGVHARGISVFGDPTECTL